MIWEYHRKEVADRRFDAYLIEMADQGWELFYARRGKETRVARDPDFWEVIWKRPKPVAAPAVVPPAKEAKEVPPQEPQAQEAPEELAEALS